MDDVPDYESYNEEQLQDALAHINREHFPANFAALQHEIERRANEPPLPKVEPSPNYYLFSMRGCGFAFRGWLSGLFFGLVAGQIWFLILAARLKSSGVDPYAHDDWGFGWLGCLFCDALVCSFIGLFVGIKRAGRNS